MCNPSPPESEQDDHCYEANTDCIVKAPSQKYQEKQAEEMTRWLRCLLFKCETQSSESQNPHKIMGGCGGPPLTPDTRGFLEQVKPYDGPGFEKTFRNE